MGIDGLFIHKRRKVSVDWLSSNKGVGEMKRAWLSIHYPCFLRQHSYSFIWFLYFPTIRYTHLKTWKKRPSIPLFLISWKAHEWTKPTVSVSHLTYNYYENKRRKQQCPTPCSENLGSLANSTLSQILFDTVIRQHPRFVPPTVSTVITAQIELTHARNQLVRFIYILLSVS